MEDELKLKVKNLIKQKKSLEQITNELQLKTYEIFGLVELLKQDGYAIDFIEDRFSFIKETPVKENDAYNLPIGENHRLLFISDTHLGSKYDRLDILRYLYDRAQNEGIDTVLHVGDMVDGSYPTRSNHQYELRAHGADEQLEYVVKKYPFRDGIKTYFINGNHDYTHQRNDGFDIGRAIDREREDMVYLGQDVADLKYGKIKIRMFHGAKGSAYARSYKLQKYVEQIPQEEIPDILLMGHYHNSFYMKYAGIHCFQVPSTLDQTPYARSLGMANEKGAWDVTFTTDSKDNILTLQPELIDMSNGKRLIKKRSN
jgi:predicted phosphodiesterase